MIGLCSPASAAVVQQKCSTSQFKVLKSPGDDVDLALAFCVQRDSTSVFRVESTTDWRHGGRVDFEKLELHLRLERYDIVQKGTVCNLRTRVNNVRVDRHICRIPWSSAAPPLTGDAMIVHNHRNDGQGDHKLEYTGTPSI
ncbi:hypothetical protein ACIBCB_10145 [Streptomyces uncialis]|uniref:hypothetical protein n=1 Tax=Streptomyces uncialis TaxID=1048205 RepID=UPI002E347209|nr:hypothetical protein [Streptomyces uncialis]